MELSHIQFVIITLVHSRMPISIDKGLALGPRGINTLENAGMVR